MQQLLDPVKQVKQTIQAHKSDLMKSEIDVQLLAGKLYE
jgi:hypothetical protein